MPGRGLGGRGSAKLYETSRYCSRILLRSLRTCLSRRRQSSVIILRVGNDRNPSCSGHCPPTFRQFNPIYSGGRLRHYAHRDVIDTCSGDLNCASCMLKRAVSLLGHGTRHFSATVLCISSRNRSLNRGKLCLRKLPCTVTPDRRADVPVMV